MEDLERLAGEVTKCRRCPRLVEWREQVARTKRASYRDDEYWGHPVPGFGDPQARVLVVGLAPAAHGANRTGRMFTGDRSGDWLYRAMHRAGFASQPTSAHRDDGLSLRGAYVTAAVRCAPPGNRPTPTEREACRPWLETELDLLEKICVIVCLGSFAYGQVLRVLAGRRVVVPAPRPPFRHGVVVDTSGPAVIGSYHPSQQNTFTGRLTEGMLDAIFLEAGDRAGHL
jgi:uracil-DNA glycosylase family 4